jgi:anti-sigma factor RsiW
MVCVDARDLLVARAREALSPEARDAVERHLETCAACRRAADAEAVLDHLLRERLPRPGAPDALRRRLEALRPRPAQSAAVAAVRPAAWRAPRWARGVRRALPALAAAILAAGGAWVVAARHAGPAAAGATALDGELVTDHLRVLAREDPAVRSSDQHQVKPWFAGRLDFAPEVPPDGGELRLVGGGVGYVLDRKAAIVTYTLRLHHVTLLAYPAAGLPAPEGRRVAGLPGEATTLRGFHVVRWRAGELEYALVSDAGDLGQLAERMAPATAPPQ